MTLGRRRTVLALAMCAVLAAIATPIAQRAYSQSYSGNVRYDGKFTFIRLSYPWYGGRGAPWAHDWPRGETHFLKIFSELTSVQMHVTESSIMSLSDPELFKFPVAYMAEPGFWAVAPGSGVIRTPPVSVCHHVSTMGQRLSPTTR